MFTPKYHYQNPIDQTCMLLDFGTWREPSHTQGEHANSILKNTEI